jgi:hypothetical protein
MTTPTKKVVASNRTTTPRKKVVDEQGAQEDGVRGRCPFFRRRCPSSKPQLKICDDELAIHKSSTNTDTLEGKTGECLGLVPQSIQTSSPRFLLSFYYPKCHARRCDMSNTRCEGRREKEYFASDHFFSFITKKSFTHYPIHDASPAYYIYNPKYRIHIVFHIQINIYEFIHTNSYIQNCINCIYILNLRV